MSLFFCFCSLFISVCLLSPSALGVGDAAHDPRPAAPAINATRSARSLARRFWPYDDDRRPRCVMRACAPNKLHTLAHARSHTNQMQESDGGCEGSDAEMMIGNGARRGERDRDRDRDRDTEEDEDEGREERSSESGGGGGFGGWRSHLLGGLTQRVKSWYWGARPLVSPSLSLYLYLSLSLSVSLCLSLCLSFYHSFSLFSIDLSLFSLLSLTSLTRASLLSNTYLTSS